MGKRPVKRSITEDDEPDPTVETNGKSPGQEESAPEGPKRIKTKSLYRQPTVRELNRLQETETLFNSNLFRLQIEEILQEVKLKEKIVTKFQQWFIDFKKHLDIIPENETEYDLSDDTLFNELKVKAPYGKDLKKTKCVFKFHKPKEVVIVGSYALDCVINSKLIIDIAMTVPAETYTKNDSLNYRYHKKRAAYLAYVASHLKKLDIIKDIKYTWQNNSHCKPFLDVTPEGKLSNHLQVRIHLPCESETYKLHRFSPSRNNLRESWLLNTEINSDSTDIGPPTPYYNSSVLSDVTASVNRDYVEGLLANSENLKQAIILLKIWLRQRKLEVSGHIVSMFVAHLVQSKRINNIMSSYQIVRNVWISWKSSEWDVKGISMNKIQDEMPSLDEFLEYFPVVFLDITGYYNMCWQMHHGTYQALKRESSLAVDILDNTSMNSFFALFMTPVTPLVQFDHILKFKNIKAVQEKVYGTVNKEAKLNYGLDKFMLVTKTVHKMLTQGLGDRVDLLQQLAADDFSCSVNESVDKAKKSSDYEEKLSFGLILNPENAFNIVLKGPPANFPEAEQFRAFWGEKSELRRFQDGSITETCVWTADTMAERRMITKQIVLYLLQLKYDIHSEIFYIGSQLDRILMRKIDEESGTGEEASLKVIQTFDELRRDMRALTELPLDVSSVYGTSSVFSYSAPLPPLPSYSPHHPRRRHNAQLIKDHRKEDGSFPYIPYTPAVRAVVELGHSGKWPGDLQAFRCLKAAFHQQIADRLNKQYSLPTQAYPTHIDVLKSGIVFRLEIAHPKEVTLLKREVESGVVKYRDNDESLNLLRNTVLLPRLRGALHGLHQKYPAYGPTACLLKRWLCCQLLSAGGEGGVTADLLSAGVFLPGGGGGGGPAPASPLAGLVRSLKLLAEKDWAREMLVLDFNGDLTREQIAAAERQHLSEEKAQIRIVTSSDIDSETAWLGPDTRLLARAQLLARTCVEYLEKRLMVDQLDNVLAIFTPSLEGYDVIIHLQSHLVPHSSERIGRPRRKKRDESIVEDLIPIVDFNPVTRYLEELRSAYSEFALFFHDSYGGDVIAVLWKPGVDDAKEFQVSTVNALHPIRKKGEVSYKINTAAIVEDFRLLGEGLVKDITVST